MKTAESELLKILSSSLFNTEFRLNGEIDYNKVLSEASAQSVLGLAYPVIKDTADIANKWQERFYLAVMHNAAVEAGHAEIHRLFTEAGIPYVTIKGCVSASYYPEPNLRTMGDVDFLVAESDFERAKEVLLKNDFSADTVDSSDRHKSFKRDGLIWELHVKIGGIPNNEAGEIGKKKLKSIIDKAVVLSTDNGEFFVPDTYHHGLVILLHAVGHITSTGIGLRHVCDWAVFVNSMPEKEFAGMFKADLEEIGLWRFARILTALCSEYLGMPQKTFAKNVDKHILADMIEDILSGGNFGKKDKDRYHGSMMMSSDNDLGAVKNVFRALNNRTRKRMPITKKVPVLLPAGWAYVGVNHLVMIAKGERPKIKVKQTLQKTASRRELIEEYMLFKK